MFKGLVTPTWAPTIARALSLSPPPLSLTNPPSLTISRLLSLAHTPQESEAHLECQLPLCGESNEQLLQLFNEAL